MRIGTVKGRATLLTISEERILAADIEESSGRQFGPDILQMLDRWEEFSLWAQSLSLSAYSGRVSMEDLEAPVPFPRQIFAVGMNYQNHAAEIGLALPKYPSVFTKFASSLTGPVATVKLPETTTDWEVELVAVIGKGGRNISRENAWGHVMGLMVGQDISERTLQFANSPAQFSLAKSYEGFSPVGPWITTLDEISDRDDLRLSCKRENTGEVLQEGRSFQMIFTIAELIEHLSSVVRLYPGDLIFTGTPDGVGSGRKPPQYIKPGDVLVSAIEGLGELRQTFV